MITLYKKVARDTILADITKNYPDHDVTRFNGFDGDASEIIHALSSSDLFGNAKVVFLSDIDRELWNDIIKALHTITDSTIVIWSEDSFPVAFTKTMPLHDVVEQKEKTESAKSNPFNIANQLSSGSSSSLWTTYRSLIAEGHAPEALFGILWWKLKDIAKKKPSITPAFKQTLKRFLSTYSQARQTGGELETGLEEVLLKLSKNDL